jgi:hypothetical protein
MLEFEDLTEAVLAGHSQGGTVLPGVAAQVPGRVRSLVYPKETAGLLDEIATTRV